MTPITPITAPPLADLRNALQMLQLDNAIWPANDVLVRDLIWRINHLLRHAIEGLSQPSLAAMQAGEILLREWSGTPEPERQLRDTVAGILHAQLSGIVPKTWEGV